MGLGLGKLVWVPLTIRGSHVLGGPWNHPLIQFLDSHVTVVRELDARSWGEKEEEDAEIQNERQSTKLTDLTSSTILKTKASSFKQQKIQRGMRGMIMYDTCFADQSIESSMFLVPGVLIPQNPNFWTPQTWMTRNL